MQCHRFGDDALHAHALPPTALSLVTAEVARGAWAPAPGASPVPAVLRVARSLGGAVPADAEMACATCHREHAGRHAGLAAMADTRCQTCHSRQFESLADGHPPLSNYPYERRTRIIFDHASHIGKHFGKVQAGEAPTACIDCHSLGAGGARMIVKPYATVCATCHADDVAGEGLAGPKGIAVFEVPGIDVETLAESGRDVGRWPAYAEARLNPFMRFLLAADAGTRDAMDRVAAVDLLDLTDAEPEVLDAAETVAWAVKDLIAEAAERGHVVIADRVADSVGVTPSEDVLAGLLGHLPLAALREGREAWFPDLADEIARHRAGLPMAPETREADSGTQPEIAVEDGDLPEGGELLDGGALLGSDDPAEAAGTENDESDDLLGGGNLLGSDESLAEDSSGGGEPSVGGGDLLGGDLLGGDLLDEPVTEAPEATDEDAAIAEAAGPPVDPEPWTSAGGWYVEHFALRYRPAGHDDRFIRTWLSLQSMALGAPGETAAAAVFEELAAPKGPGACMLCHSIDARQDEVGRTRLLVNWDASPPLDTSHHFTRYAHKPHFSLLDERGCLTCHKLDYGASYADSFDDRDPTVFVSNFEPMEKAVCAACHTGAKAGDRCTDCHGYHVGDFPPALAEAPLTLDRNAQGDR